MSLEIEERLEKIPIVNWFVRLLKEMMDPAQHALLLSAARWSAPTEDGLWDNIAAAKNL